MKFDVAIIIVTYNSAGEIAACLRSVIDECENVSQQIIVVDNASKDRTVDLIRDGFPSVDLVLPGKNLGFAAGVNLGVKHSTSDFVLLLNPDTLIVRNAIGRIVEFARMHPRHGLYGGRTLAPDGSLEPSSCWGTPSLWSMFLFAFGVTTLAPRNRWLDPESLGAWQRNSVREVGVITGCFLLAPRTVWDELAGFDLRYFMYGEDVDLSIRARKAGYRPVICPTAELVHEIGKSSDTPIHKTLLLYKGKASLVRSHWTGLGKWCGLAFLATGTGLRAALSNFCKSVGTGSDAGRWTTVWKQRKQWLCGYDEDTSNSPGQSTT